MKRNYFFQFSLFINHLHIKLQQRSQAHFAALGNVTCKTELSNKPISSIDMSILGFDGMKFLASYKKGF